MIGEQPVLGRTFETDDLTSESAAVIVLSHGTWQRYFAGAPDVLGQRVTLDREPYTVIGVMGPDFQFPYPKAQFWVPLIGPTDDRARFQWSAPVARLKDGVTIEATAAEVSRILQDLRGGIGGSTPAGPSGAGRQDPSPGSPFWTGPFGLVQFRDDLVAPVKPALVALAAAVGFVLLIACVNVANLLLARMTARRHEIGIRHALGAGRGRLICQALIESVLLAIVGGIAGIGLASGGIALFRTIGGAPSRRDVGPFQLDIPRMDALGIDASVLELTVVISLVTAGVFGLIPALRQARSADRDGVYHSTGVSPISGFGLLRQYRLQGLLIVAEVAMAMVLFVGGALQLFSVANLSKVSRGYDARNVLTFQVSVPWGRVFLGPSTPAERQRVTTFAEALVGRLAAVPGVRSAGYARQLPMFQLYMENVPLSRQPRPPDAPPPPPPPPPPGGPPADFTDARVVSRDFFTVMGTRIVAGRGFADRDGQGQPRVAIINETLARSGLLGANPIGQQVYVFGPAPWDIVGIVEDVRQVSLEQAPRPQVFFDFRQRPAAEGPYFVVRTSGADHRTVTSSLLWIVRQLEPSATLDNVASMEELVTTSMHRRRLYAALSGLLAALAVGLAAVGIYGVMTYSVAQRTRELGIRMALGAQKSTVLGLVLGQSLTLTGAGIILGLAGATAVTRYLEGMLFGLTPLDPSTFISVSMLFALVAGIAAYIPAHRATKVDPMVALRCE